MPRHRSLSTCVLLLLFAASVAAQKSPDAVQAAEAEKQKASAMLESARSLSDLHQAGTGPYRLQASFETYDYKGVADGKGVLTEVYLRDGYWQRFILYRDKHSKRTVVNGKYGYVSEPDFQTTFAMDHVVDDLFAPIPSERALMQYTFTMKPLNSPGVSLDCVIGSLPYTATAREADLDFHPGMIFSRNLTAEEQITAPNAVYCIDKNPAIIRMIQGHGGLVYTFNRILRFGSVFVPGDITMMEKGKMRAHLHVDGIVAAADLSEKDIIIPSEPNGGAQVISGAMTEGRVKSKISPVYPVDAKRRGVQGTVVMHAIIGKDGHIRDLELVSTPDDSLAGAAMYAARQWTYHPFQLGGSPVEVDTVLTTHFAIR